MNTWVRFDIAIFDDPWYMSLPAHLARVFLHLVIYSAKGSGTCDYRNPGFLASRLGVKPTEITALIKASEGRIIASDGQIEVKNYRKWNPRTDAERQRDSRTRKQEQGDKQCHADVTPMSQKCHTDVTKTVTENEHKSHAYDTNDTIRYENIPSKESPLPPLTDVDNSKQVPSMPSSANAKPKPPPSRTNGAFQHVSDEVKTLAAELLTAALVSDHKDRQDIGWDVYHAVNSGYESSVRRLIAEVKQGEHSGAANIVAVVRAKLKSCSRGP